jgi:hypothetical protein
MQYHIVREFTRFSGELTFLFLPFIEREAEGLVKGAKLQELDGFFG